MVVDDTSTAHQVKVTIGVKATDAWEITQGLNEGQTVIVEGNYALPDGTTVSAVDAASSSATGGAPTAAQGKP
jgi:multidrug efflux pump subunit AcrA (membrane-fusion protein)